MDRCICKYPENLRGFLQLSNTSIRITTLFTALCIHTIDFRRSIGMHRNLAEGRAKLCLLGLREVQKSWRVNDLILDLFMQQLDEVTASRFQDEDTNAVSRDTVESTLPQNGSSIQTKSNPQTLIMPPDDVDTSNITAAHWNDIDCTPNVFDQAELTEYFTAFLDSSMYNDIGTGFEDFELLQRCL